MKLFGFGGTIRPNPVGIGIVVCATILLYLYYTHGSTSDSKDTYLNGKVKLRRLLLAAVDVAERGGREVKAVQDPKLGEKSKGKTQEGVNIPVTQGDMQSHRQMYYGLKNAFPGLKIVSEEHDDTGFDPSSVPLPQETNQDILKIIPAEILAPLEDVTVWIDPLDATKEYTEKLFDYVTTMVCVAVKGEPIIGVIHKPYEGESGTTYWAWVNQGVSPNLQKTDNIDNPGQKVRVIVSISHAGGIRDVVISAFGKRAAIVHAAGAGYKALEVAAKRQDVYLHGTPIAKWDICAGTAVLHALKGAVTDMNGHPINYSAQDSPVVKDGLVAVLDKSAGYLEQLKAPGKTEHQ